MSGGRGCRRLPLPRRRPARRRILRGPTFLPLLPASVAPNLPSCLFANLTNEEFVANYTGYRRSNGPNPGTTHFMYDNVTRVASTVDWRTRGAVTPVKDQSRCALVDCDFSNGACDRGRQDKAFAFVASNGGITTEANYPYLGYQGICFHRRLRVCIGERREGADRGGGQPTCVREHRSRRDRLPVIHRRC
ncbi:hypothetical protein GW17_00053653 [Ensete ventricosum]|nr:hypothetical protein GW17_00053653 [Ensete ventricosum]